MPFWAALARVDCHLCRNDAPKNTSAAPRRKTGKSKQLQAVGRKLSGDWRPATGDWYYRGVETPATNVFARGAVVLVTLNGPREKFWGAIVELTPAGLAMRGIDLNSFDDFARLVRDGEPAAAGIVFFPMHRVERIELDVRSGGIPSLGERFLAKSGREPAAVLDVALAERG